MVATCFTIRTVLCILALNADMDLNKTYTVHMQSKNWSEASEICKNEGKRLLTMQTLEVFKPLLVANKKQPFDGIL